MSFNIYGYVAIHTLLLHYIMFRWVAHYITAAIYKVWRSCYFHVIAIQYAVWTCCHLHIISIWYKVGTCCHVSVTVALHYCRSPLYVIATHIKCRHVVVYMLVLYYINCVVIYALLHCMSKGTLLFICYCYTTYSVNMLPFKSLVQCGNSLFQIFLKSHQDDQWEGYAADPNSSTSFRMQDLNWHQLLCE